MDGGVCRILELLQQNVTIRFCGGDFFRFRHCTRHAARALRQYELRSECDEQLAPFDAHRFGHRERQRNAACRCHVGKGNACIAAGGFDDFLAGAEQAARFSIPDHRSADAALDGIGRVSGFDFRQDRGGGMLCDAVEADQRRAAD